MKKTEKMQIINLHAAGIDVGSRSHFVAVGQNPEDVREFGVYSANHAEMISFLKCKGITTIAMESTGSYWQTLFFELQRSGYEVILVSGYQTKNVRAKTDVKDCQWIQKLHSLGLLRGCFLPSEQTARLRVLHRHRSSIQANAAAMINKMQKSLRLMNLRLDVVLGDIVGKTGTAIIESILQGERNGLVLAQLTDPRVRKSKQEIADALQGQWSDELLYELEDCYDIYKTFQLKMQKCDQKIEALLKSFLPNPYNDKQQIDLAKKQLKGRNQPKFDLSWLSYNYYGVDLFAIEGIGTNTIMTLITEIGLDLSKFKTAKQFTSYLRLAPNNRVSGGKIISSRTPKGANKFALSLRNAANSIDRIKVGNLTSFFKRVAYKKGRAAAITATARKLAVIIWNMAVKKQAYQPIQNEIYEGLVKQKRIAAVKRMMKNSNISFEELGIT